MRQALWWSYSCEQDRLWPCGATHPNGGTQVMSKPRNRKRIQIMVNARKEREYLIGDMWEKST